MQCACAIQLFVACPALQYFSTFSHKRHDFRKKKKKVIEHITRVFSLQLFPETFLILRRNERDMNKNVHVPVIFVRFWWNLNFLDILSNNTQISNFMKICAVWEESFHADARTDRPKDITKLNTFSHFFSLRKLPNSSKNCDTPICTAHNAQKKNINIYTNNYYRI